MAGHKLPEIARAYNKMWREKNREHRKAYEKAYYAKNRDAIRERNRERIKEWHDANPEAIKEHKRRYREANREKIREAARQSRRDEKGDITVEQKQRQARAIAQRIVDLETLAGRPRPDTCDIAAAPAIRTAACISIIATRQDSSAVGSAANAI